jgi:hypothetical protein
MTKAILQHRSYVYHRKPVSDIKHNHMCIIPINQSINHALYKIPDTPTNKQDPKLTKHKYNKSNKKHNNDKFHLKLASSSSSISHDYMNKVTKQ